MSRVNLDALLGDIDAAYCKRTAPLRIARRQLGLNTWQFLVHDSLELGDGHVGEVADR
jgi:hypothetical protein